MDEDAKIASTMGYQEYISYLMAENENKSSAAAEPPASKRGHTKSTNGSKKSKSSKTDVLTSHGAPR